MDNKKTKIKNIVIAVLAVVIIACVVILVVGSIPIRKIRQEIRRQRHRAHIRAREAGSLK